MNWTIRFRFEPRDIWVGIYWKWWKCVAGKYLDVYVCILPMLPISFHFYADTLEKK